MTYYMKHAIHFGVAIAIIVGVFYVSPVKAQVWELENQPTFTSSLACSRINVVTNALCGLYIETTSTIFFDLLDIDMGAVGQMTPTTTLQIRVYTVDSETEDLDEVNLWALSNIQTLADVQSSGDELFRFANTFLPADKYIFLINLIDFTPTFTNTILVRGNSASNVLYDSNRYQADFTFNDLNGVVQPRFRIGKSGDPDPVIITYPANGSIVNDFNLTEFGTCTQGFDIEIAKLTSTSTPFIAQSNACVSNSWSFFLGQLEQGYYWTHVSTTDFDIEEIYFFLAQNLELPTSTIPGLLESLEGGESSFWTGLYNKYLLGFNNLRPYSYIPQVFTSIVSSTNNASGTNPFPVLNLSFQNFNSTTTFNIGQPNVTDTYDVFPEADWAIIRTTFELVIFISLAFYIWHKIKRII